MPLPPDAVRIDKVIDLPEDAVRIGSQRGEILSPASYREKKAERRGGSFDWLGSIKQKEEEVAATRKPSFVGSFIRELQIPLAVASGVANVGESALSDVALGLTERRPQDIPRHLQETFTGKRTSKFPDVAESIGIPEGMLSSAAGLAIAFGISNIGTGGKLGKAIFEAGAKGARSVGGGINKAIEATKEGFQTLKGLKIPRTAILEKERFLIQTSKKARLGQIQESTQLARHNLNKLKDATQQIFDNNYKVLSDKLKDASEEGVLNFQKALPEFYKSVGDSYGSALDDVANNLTLTRGDIGINEVNTILRKSLEEISSENLNYGKAFDKLNELYNGKYAMSSGNLTKTFNLTGVKNDIDQVFKTAKYMIKGTGEDIPAHILRKNWGEFATQNIEGYGDLQRKYSEVVDAMKLSDKLFKPKAGELYAEKGASFLRKFGLAEKPPLAQQKLLTTIEKGTEMGRGVGRLSQPIREIGNELRLLKEANSVMKNNISQRLDKLNISSQQLKRSLTKKFDARIDGYTSKLMDRKKAVSLARALGLGVGGLIGAYQGAKALSNIAGFRESYGE